MLGEDKDSKLFIGLLVGGVLGMGALGILLATRKEKTPLSGIGETVARIGEILEEHHIEEPASLKRVEKKIHKRESSILQIVDWVATGVSLWKQLKK